MLLSTDVAAVALGVTDRTIRRWVVSGRLRNHGTARHIRVDLAELNELVAAAADVR